MPRPTGGRTGGVLALLGLVLLAACSSGGGADATTERKAAVPVIVATVEQRDAPVNLHAIGNVEAFSTVTVKSQVQGQVAEVHFNEGQELHRGELLFLIDPRPFEAALHETEGALARDQAQAEHARVEAERFARLVRSGVVAREEYDRVRTQAAALTAAVKADEAAVERARIQLQFCSITSPIDGRIGQILVHQGNVVKENETMLAVIHQLRPVYVAFSVPQHELPAIRTHMAGGPLPVEAVIPGSGATPVAGELSFVNNAVDTATGTVLLKAVFQNPDETLWPGQFVNVTLRLTTLAGALLVPARAVQTGQQGKYVFVVQPDGTVASRPVTVGQAVGDAFVVEQGLTAGERVVVEGQLRLAPGMPVEVKGTA